VPGHKEETSFFHRLGLYRKLDVFSSVRKNERLQETDGNCSSMVIWLVVCSSIVIWLVVWNMAFMTFHSVGNVIIPTDEVTYFSEG
jgi:hypothetical protein